jgi:hypothetical protein
LQCLLSFLFLLSIDAEAKLACIFSSLLKTVVQSLFVNYQLHFLHFFSRNFRDNSYSTCIIIGHRSEVKILSRLMYMQWTLECYKLYTWNYT